MDPKLVSLFAKTDQDDYANALRDLLRETPEHELVLAAMAGKDPELRNQLVRSCLLFFGCLTGMDDKALAPMLQLAADIEARDCFDQLFDWFKENRIEGSDLWPVKEDEAEGRIEIVKLSLKTLALLQPSGVPSTINYWLQMWGDEQYAAFHAEAYLGLIISDPMFAATELSQFMYLGLPETKELLHRFHAREESRDYLLQTIERGRSYEADWAIAAAKQLGLP